jgi:hypothetical protein
MSNTSTASSDSKWAAAKVSALLSFLEAARRVTIEAPVLQMETEVQHPDDDAEVCNV